MKTHPIFGEGFIHYAASINNIMIELLVVWIVYCTGITVVRKERKYIMLKIRTW